MCVLVLVGPFASQDDPSFVSSLSRCLNVCQVDYLCVCVCVSLLVLVGPFASQDDPSFVSSLLRTMATDKGWVILTSKRTDKDQQGHTHTHTQVVHLTNVETS